MNPEETAAEITTEVLCNYYSVLQQMDMTTDVTGQNIALLRSEEKLKNKNKLHTII